MNKKLLPYGMSKADFDNCKRIVSEISGKEDAEELVLNIARITYANGGDYKEETLLKFARAYIDINR